MSWLRLSGFEAKEPQLISDAAGHLIEVLVHVRPVDDVYPVCCLAQKLVKNGSKTVRYRDRRIEPAPTWLVVRRQRMRCRSCDSTLYQAVPHVDDKHYVTERLARDLALSGSKRGFRDAVAMHAVEETLVRRIFRKFADINRAGNGMDFQTLRAKAILRHGRVLPDGALDHYISDRSTRYAG